MAGRRTGAAEPPGAGEIIDVDADGRPVPLPPSARVAPVPPLGYGESFSGRCRAQPLQDILERIAGGTHMFQLAEWLQVTPGALAFWIASDEQIKRAVAEARRIGGQFWDESATVELGEAKSWFDLEKAKHRAAHFRWRASKLDSATYGEKQQLEVNTRQLPIEDVDKRITELATFWAAPTQPAMQLPADFNADDDDLGILE